MGDPFLPIVLVFASLGACLSAAVLFKVWNGWLDLKRSELAARQSPASGFVSARIELADLKERVRRLEAISEGADPASSR